MPDRSGSAHALDSNVDPQAIRAGCEALLHALASPPQDGLTVRLCQVRPQHWLPQGELAGLREQVERQLLRAMLVHPERLSVRRLLLYDLPSDLGSADHHQRLDDHLRQWRDQVTRGLAFTGRRGLERAATTPVVAYDVRVVILGRATAGGAREEYHLPADGALLSDDAPGVAAFDRAFATAARDYVRPGIGEQIPASDLHPASVVGA